MGKKRDGIKGILKMAGIAIIGAAIGIGGMNLTLDLVDHHHASVADGLPLLANGVHLKEGEHNVVITEQFDEMLHFGTTEEDEFLVVNAFKEAYTTLNNYNSKVNFNLCTQDENLAEKYDIPKVDSIGKQDIPLYMTTEVLDNNKNVMAHTNWHYELFSHELKDLSITFRKNYLLMVWDELDTIEETLSAHNAAAYTTAVHESMHAMGFAHIDDRASIMNTYVKPGTPKDVTEYDIYLLDKYNVQFYGAEPTYTGNIQEVLSAPLTVSTDYTVTYSDNKNNEPEQTM